jgi:hypothetical protein
LSCASTSPATAYGVNTPKSYGKPIKPSDLPEGIAHFFPVGTSAPVLPLIHHRQTFTLSDHCRTLDKLEASTPHPTPDIECRMIRHCGDPGGYTHSAKGSAPLMSDASPDLSLTLSMTKTINSSFLTHNPGLRAIKLARLSLTSVSPAGELFC